MSTVGCKAAGDQRGNVHAKGRGFVDALLGSTDLRGLGLFAVVEGTEGDPQRGRFATVTHHERTVSGRDPDFATEPSTTANIGRAARALSFWDGIIDDNPSPSWSRLGFAFSAEFSPSASPLERTGV